MNYKSAIEVLKKVYNYEIDICDNSYVDASKSLCFYAGIDAIKNLFELFDDNCYEIGLMDDLTETIFYIVDRYGKEGLLEVSRCLKYTPECGKYFGIDHMIHKVLDTDSLYTLWIQLIGELNASDKKFILQELKRMNVKSKGIRKERISVIMEALV